MTSPTPRRQHKSTHGPHEAFRREGLNVQADVASGVAQLAQTSGNQSPVIASGAHSRNVYQSGERSTVHIGDYLDQLPQTTREDSKSARGTTLGLGLVTALGAASSIATITGLDVGELRLGGLLPLVRDVREDGLLPALAQHDSSVLLRLTFCLILMLLPLTFYSRLRQRGWVSSIRGRIFERRDGRLTSARVVGICPIPHCGGPTRVKRVVVDHKPYTTQDLQGRQVQKERAIKEFRLVCRRNGDHRFRFDVTNCSDAGGSDLSKR